jgi:serine/threonine-protein kinase
MNPTLYAQVKGVFLRALDVAPDRRADFVKEQCAGDAAMIAEVESLLANHVAEQRATVAPSARGVSLRSISRSGGGATGRSLQNAASRLRTTLGSKHSQVRLKVLALLGVLALTGAVAGWAQWHLERTTRELAVAQLRTALDATASALEVWAEGRVDQVARTAAVPDVRTAAIAVLDLTDPLPDAAVRGRVEASAAYKALAEALKPMLSVGGFDAFGIVDRDYRIAAATLPQLVGLRMRTGSDGLKALVNALVGKPMFYPPHMLGASFDLPPGLEAVRQPVLQIWAPLRDAQGKIRGSLGFAMDVRSQFQRFLQGRPGETGEVYAFDARGLMLSVSRFDPELRAMGLLGEGETSLLRTQVRVPAASDDAAELTKLASRAIESRTETDPARLAGTLSTPYRDYRGVEVIGAWRWLPDLDLGLANEADRAEVASPLRYLWWAFGGLIAMLLLLLGSNVWSAFAMERLRREVSQRRRIGSYKLVRKLGEGGLGEVFLARHDLLKRPTAIKVLKSSVADGSAIAMFEREVQATCRLTHPNTVTIYDFGHTADRTLYYAMEYLRGLDLGALVGIEGRVPARRVVHILRQACLSLNDAHENGLLHRDVKPQNIMICRLGGLTDVVKVVDFGLVKELFSRHGDETRQVRGTPLYMAPERFREGSSSDDPRVDVYGVGATAYKLLAGRNLFGSTTDAGVVYEALHSTPADIAVLCPDCPIALARLVMDCVSRDPAQRPPTIAAILERLEATGNLKPWTAEDAAQWWAAHPELGVDHDIDSP